MSSFVLTLYITGQTPTSQRAITDIRRLCEEQFGGHYDLTIIDVREHPQLAERARVIATPTLLRELPLPIRRLVGDFSQPNRVLLGLGLQE